MKQDRRRPYFALLVMFNAIAGPKAVARTKSIESLIQSELSRPSPEALAAMAFFCEVPDWTVEEQERTLLEYFKPRGTKSGLRLPRLFEAAVVLELAERHRSGDNIERARELVTMAADNYPEHEQLRIFSKDVAAEKTHNWRRILLPAKRADLKEASDSTKVAVD